MSSNSGAEEPMRAMSLMASDQQQGDEGGGSKGTAKRDALRANEAAVQRLWEEARAFEGEPDGAREHFLVTFPYRAFGF